MLKRQGSNHLKTILFKIHQCAYSTTSQFSKSISRWLKVVACFSYNNWHRPQRKDQNRNQWFSLPVKPQINYIKLEK